MFSDNHKISLRQVKYMVFMDILGILCILLPVYLQNETIGSMAVSLLAGLLVWLLFAGLLARGISSGRTPLEAVRKTAGPLTVFFLLAAAVVYLAAQAAVFLNLCAELAGTYLLPETPLPVLVLLPLAAGLFLARGGLEVRARTSEVLGPVVLVLFLIMGAGAALGIRNPGGTEDLLRIQDESLLGGYEIFACAGGLFLPALTGHIKKEEEGQEKKTSRYLRAGGILGVLLSGILLLITALSFGSGGMQAIEFPAVRVMSSVSLPGGFLKRWDVIFLLLILFSMGLACGSAFWNLKESSRALWEMVPRAGQNQKGCLAFQGLLVLLVYGAAAGFLNAQTAMCYYRALNLQILTPLFLLVLLLLYFRLKKTGVMAAAALAAVFLLGGCTARELEERLFPTVLQVSLEGEEVQIAYAWNQGTGLYAGEEETETDSEGAAGENQNPAGSGAEAESPLTLVRGKNLEEVFEKVENYSERYMDYSHVKALLLDEKIQDKPELKEELIKWLAGDPAFSANLILFPMRESGLDLEKAQEHSSGQAGQYLENLYEHNDTYRSQAITLGEWIRQQAGSEKKPL